MSELSKLSDTIHGDGSQSPSDWGLPITAVADRCDSLHTFWKVKIRACIGWHVFRSSICIITSRRNCTAHNKTFPPHLCHLGVPKEIKTDNGPTCTSCKLKDFFSEWGIAHKTGIPVNPTGQSIVERTHQTLKRVLNQQNLDTSIKSPVERLCKALSMSSTSWTVQHQSLTRQYFAILLIPRKHWETTCARERPWNTPNLWTFPTNYLGPRICVCATTLWSKMVPRKKYKTVPRHCKHDERWQEFYWDKHRSSEKSNQFCLETKTSPNTHKQKNRPPHHETADKKESWITFCCIKLQIARTQNCSLNYTLLPLIYLKNRIIPFSWFFFKTP